VKQANKPKMNFRMVINPCLGWNERMSVADTEGMTLAVNVMMQRSISHC